MIGEMAQFINTYLNMCTQSQLSTLGTEPHLSCHPVRDPDSFYNRLYTAKYCPAIPVPKAFPHIPSQHWHKCTHSICLLRRLAT